MKHPGLFVDGWAMFRADDIASVAGVSYSSISKNNWK
jgi:hypothetical protein